MANPEHYLFQRHDEPPSGDRAIAHAKIMTHLWELSPKLNALTMSGQSKMNKERMREESRRWFFERSDCEQWCNQAGFELEYVRKKAKEVYENGMPKWRLDSGERKNMTKEQRARYDALQVRKWRAEKMGVHESELLRKGKRKYD